MPTHLSPSEGRARERGVARSLRASFESLRRPIIGRPTIAFPIINKQQCYLNEHPENDPDEYYLNHTSPEHYNNL